jgi:hypothetical protein
MSIILPVIDRGIAPRHFITVTREDAPSRCATVNTCRSALASILAFVCKVLHSSDLLVRVVYSTGISRFPHQPLQLLRLFLCDKLPKPLHCQEIVIRELKTWYHRLRSVDHVSLSLIASPASTTDPRATYLTDQQPFPFCPIKQEAGFVFPPFNDPHTLLSFRDVVSNGEGFDTFLGAGFVGVDEDVATSA